MKNNFTLIELLVVIAIIAILMALFFPSLKTAKDITKQVNCLSDQKQIAQMDRCLQLKIGSVSLDAFLMNAGGVSSSCSWSYILAIISFPFRWYNAKQHKIARFYE